MPKVEFHTLGCKLNYAETATMARQFSEKGFEISGEGECSDVAVINTCSVTERADRECRQIVRRIQRRSPEAFVVVVGCYAQLQPGAIAAIPGVDLVLGTKEKFEIFEHAGSFHKLSCAQTYVSPVSELNEFSAASSTDAEDRTRAFLKVQDGCDYSCSFCTIPLARGQSRSSDIAQIVKEAEAAVRLGFKEIVLTGVNVGDYGRQNGSSLLELVRNLVEVDGLVRLRISSIEPNLLTDDLLSFWADNSVVCNHFHVPLQSGSDAILQLMRRRYLTRLYAERIEMIRKRIPDAGIGADVIAGFPGESDKLFTETYNFLVELPISYLHAFTYSPRPNTPAAASPDHVEPRVRFARGEQLRVLSAKKRHAFQQRFVGSVLPVLVEGKHMEGNLTGLSTNYLRVSFEGPESLTNRVIPVRIVATKGDYCIGTALDTSASESNGSSTISGEVSLCA